MEDKIKSEILKIAHNDSRIRAVLLNGSRANIFVTPDSYQDYDVVFIVEEMETFLKDRTWISKFGKVVLQQFPDEMILGRQETNSSFGILMIFEDGNRIDLTLFPREKLETEFRNDSLTLVWLDKDGLFRDVPPPSDKDYHIERPDEKAFAEVCNEFWWTITNVAKGLKRGEIIYAKDMLERVVRPMFWQMIEWNIGMENDFSVSAGKSGKFARKFLSEELYQEVLKTYSGADTDSNRNAMWRMAGIFGEQQKKLAAKLQFFLNQDEIDASLKYISR